MSQVRNVDLPSNAEGRRRQVRLVSCEPETQISADTRQWTIKGLSPKTVEVSRDAAKKSGMKLNSWIGQALETAAEAEKASVSDNPINCSAPPTNIELHAVEAELEKVRARTAHLESTVNNLSSILLKLLAQQP